MKKIIITLALAFAAVALYAQPRAVGLKIGPEYGATYQHALSGSDNFIQADFTYGLANGYSFSEEILGAKFGKTWGGLIASASYNFMIAKPNWTSQGEWAFYAGPGAYLGGVFVGGGEAIMAIGAQAHCGLEYTFENVPIQLSAELNPMFGALVGNGAAEYHLNGLYGFIPSIGVRYRF